MHILPVFSFQVLKKHAGGITLIESTQEKKIDTDFRYAIIAGWLIIPAIEVIFSFIGIVSSLFVSNLFAYDSSNQWIYIFSYIVSWLYIPLLFI